MTRAYLSLLLLLVAGSSFAADDWNTYVNARFGFQVTYPPALIPGEESQNGDGRIFSTKAGDFTLRAYAHFLNDNTLESLWQDALKDYGDAITYKAKKKDWFVVSGRRDGQEFYYRIYTMEGNFAALLMEYTPDKKYDAWVERISTEFKPFLKGDFDRIVP